MDEVMWLLCGVAAVLCVFAAREVWAVWKRSREPGDRDG